MSVPVHLIAPGDLVSFLYWSNSHGTALGFGKVLSRSEHSVTVKAPADAASTVNGTLTVSATPDYVNVCAPNGRCHYCGCEVYVGCDQDFTTRDMSGDVGCFAAPDGYHHGSPLCQETSRAGSRRVGV